LISKQINRRTISIELKSPSKQYNIATMMMCAIDNHDRQQQEQQQRRPRSVQFQSVEIIELAYTVGDNPSVSSGVPLSIEWGAQRRSTLELTFFENHRPPRGDQCARMSSRFRAKLLLRSGYSHDEIQTATEEAHRTKMGRSKTIGQWKKMAVLKAAAAAQQQAAVTAAAATVIVKLSNVSPNIRFARSA
jgi:hypothetical protein